MLARGLALLACLLCAAGVAMAAPSFPALTGRVVDTAHLLSSDATQSLTNASAQLEQQTGDQLVIVTIPSLQGETIEDYGYQLGRHWGIGQKGKDNGVLLIVAPKEHKVRIEVGYGLEGTLTDALTSQIIQTIILPPFRQGDMQQGIMGGAQAILNILHGQQADFPAQTSNARVDMSSLIWAVFVFGLFLFRPLLLLLYGIACIPADLLAWLGFSAFKRWLAAVAAGSFGLWVAHVGSYNGPYVGSFGSSGGGGFSGGGGSFGGGGSSGGW